MVRTVAQLYNNFKLLIKQWVYDKDEIDNLLDDKADAQDIPTSTSDLVNDSGFLTNHQSLANYYTKSEIDELLGDIEEDMLS